MTNRSAKAIAMFVWLAASNIAFAETEMVQNRQNGPPVFPEGRSGSTREIHRVRFYLQSALTDVDALGNPLRRIDHGFYLLAERTLLADGLSGFIRSNTVSKDVYQADWSEVWACVIRGCLTDAKMILPALQ